LPTNQERHVFTLSGAQIKKTTAAALLACGFLTGCDLERCVPAETVRVKIQETVYRLPAVFQPYISVGNKAFPIQYKIRGGWRIKEYCQKPEDPPPTAGSFGFGQKSIDLIATRRPEFSHLRELDVIAVHNSPASHHPAERASGSLVNGGLYRRLDHKGSFELFSTGPLLFGGQISALCGSAATHEPSISCDIWGQIAPGILVRVQLNDSTHPLSEWPRTLEEVERLIKSFATP
jgi:hypothetical protein